MKLPTRLHRSPRLFLLLAMPIVVLVATLGIALGKSGGSGQSGVVVAPATVTVSVSSALSDSAPKAPASQSSSLASTTVAASPTSRNDCAAIRGSDYRSGDERDWFLKNCGATGGALSAANAAPPPTASSAAATSAASSAAPTSAARTASTGPAPVASSVQKSLGDRLVIPAANVDTSVWSAKVGTNGQMPDPTGYFNAVWYDFSEFPGLGGYVNGGNLVMAGHVDCGKCYSGSAGTAVFWSTRKLVTGDKAQYYAADGRVLNYVVTSSKEYSPSTDWGSIVASSAADLTIITCTGNFYGGEYSLRHVVAFKKV